jgi:uncharacterized membrane protein YhaH (DUF805 family)
MRWIIAPFRRCFDYSGRSRRMEYWSYALLTFVTMIVLGFIETKLGLARTGASGHPESPLRGVVFLGLMIPGLAVSVRRLHDTDRVGWWVALPVAPILFWIVALVAEFNSPALFKPVMVAILVAPLILLAFMCVPGTKGPNRFGPDPKADDLANIFA